LILEKEIPSKLKAAKLGKGHTKSINLSQDEIYINPKRKEKEKREIQKNIRKEIGDLQRANS